MTTDHKDLSRPKKFEPGNELHFALLGTPWHFNFLRGKDYADMQGFARAVWDAAIEHDRAQRVAPAEVLEEAMRLAFEYRSAMSHAGACATCEELYAYLSLHLGAQRVEQAEPVGPAYGVIDPDYARVFTMARCLAWSEGYALAMHGSFTRDLDLIAIPWTEAACDPQHLQKRIADATGLRTLSAHSDKVHGRMAWTMVFPGFADPRFVDFSVMPRVMPPASAPARTAGDAAQGDIEEAAQRLVEAAEGANFVVTIYTVPLPPLRMGNYRHEFHVRPRVYPVVETHAQKGQP